MNSTLRLNGFTIDGLIRFSEWLREPPSGGSFQKWFAGAGLAGLTTCFGLWIIVSRQPWFLELSSGRAGSAVSETEAIAGGCVALSVGLFIHFQWFWGNHETLAHYYGLGKLITAIGFVVSLVASIGLAMQW